MDRCYFSGLWIPACAGMTGVGVVDKAARGSVPPFYFFPERLNHYLMFNSLPTPVCCGKKGLTKVWW